MANTPAIGNGPFEFTSASGKQISIPLSAFSFDANGNIVVDPNWNALTQAQPGSSFLAYAVREGLLAPAPAPSLFPAMIIKATDLGTGGNNISVTVAVMASTTSPPSNDPAQTQFSLTVTETDFYSGLTTASIEGVLGSSAVSGSSPGLVQIASSSVDLTGEPIATSGSLSGSPAQIDVPGGGSPGLAFTLIAKKSGSDGSLTKVTVTPDSSSPAEASSTFSLLATWTKTSNGLTVADIDTLAAGDLGYEITVSKPSGGAYSVPAAGVTQLSGGGPGASASATLFTRN